jgi:hypothetical protein
LPRLHTPLPILIAGDSTLPTGALNQQWPGCNI